MIASVTAIKTRSRWARMGCELTSKRKQRRILPVRQAFEEISKSLVGKIRSSLSPKLDITGLETAIQRATSVRFWSDEVDLAKHLSVKPELNYFTLKYFFFQFLLPFR